MAGGAEGVPAERNPFDLLICDSDALIQIFCTDQETLLKKLRLSYGITSAVTEAVEMEILRPGRKLGACCQAGFRKAIESGLLTVIDRRTLGKFTANDPHSTYDSIQNIGQDYNKVIDRGEAFTHAAARVLRAAVLSNDFQSRLAADSKGLILGKPTLRFYDLVVFLHQCGELTERDCDNIRKELFRVGDSIHSAFAARKFVQGLARFYPRIVNPDFEIIGSATTTELGDENRVEIRKVQPQRK
jgi:hypothetical protein